MCIRDRGTSRPLTVYVSGLSCSQYTSTTYPVSLKSSSPCFPTTRRFILPSKTLTGWLNDFSAHWMRLLSGLDNWKVAVKETKSCAVLLSKRQKEPPEGVRIGRTYFHWSREFMSSLIVGPPGVPIPRQSEVEGQFVWALCFRYLLTRLLTVSLASWSSMSICCRLLPTLTCLGLPYLLSLIHI